MEDLIKMKKSDNHANFLLVLGNTIEEQRNIDNGRGDTYYYIGKSNFASATFKAKTVKDVLDYAVNHEVNVTVQYEDNPDAGTFIDSW